MEDRDQNGRIDPGIPRDGNGQNSRSNPNGQNAPNVQSDRNNQGNPNSRSDTTSRSTPSSQSNPSDRGDQSNPGSPDDRGNLNDQNIRSNRDSVNGRADPDGYSNQVGCGEETGTPGGCVKENSINPGSRAEGNSGIGARRSIARWLSVALFTLSALCLCVYLYSDARGGLTVARRFLFLGVFVALSYPAARLYLRGKARGQDKRCAERVLLPLFGVYFALYLHLLLTLTLLDPSLGRDLIWAENSRAYYLEWYVNLRPFHTIWNVYIVGGLGKGLLSHASIVFNLLGNLAVLSPLALFLPLFFRPMRRFYVFLPTVLFVTALIEALQFCFMRGSCDIDDLLLNAGGAFLFWLFLKIPPVSRFADFLTAGLWTETADSRKPTGSGRN